MKNLQLILISIFALTLAACGGDDGKKQDSPKTDDKKDTVTNTCVLKADTITLSGIKYNTADYDKDGDGCLSAKEFNDLKEKAKADAAKLLAELEARAVKAENDDIKNTSTEFPQIQSLTIVGSDAPATHSSKKHAVLDANKNGGKFIVSFKFDRNLKLDKSANQQESLRIGIGPDASSEIITKAKDMPAHINVTSLIHDQGDTLLRMDCIYDGSNKTYSCLKGKAKVDFPASMVIPSNANLFLLMCQGPYPDNYTCTNHANIKLELK